MRAIALAARQQPRAKRASRPAASRSESSAAPAAIGCVLALMGPFGTFAVPLGLRLLDSQVFIFGGYCVFRPVAAAGSLIAEHGGMPRWLVIGLACAPAGESSLPEVARLALSDSGPNPDIAPAPQPAMVPRLLVLLRLADTVAELDGIEGLRTHRSWWVARDAVAQVLSCDRAMRLRLVNGIEVPVARNAVAALRAAGWLDA